MTHKGTVTPKTQRLVLRRFTIEDSEAAFRNWTNDSLVTKYLTWQPHKDISATGQIIESWVEQYANPDYYQWAIEFEGEPIGSIAAVEVNDKTQSVQIGYCIGSKFWHRGIMTEALSAVIDFFFREVGANRVEAFHDVNNPNSGKVMAKCGMKYEGTLRRSHVSNQGIYDACCYSILAEEYNPHN